MSDLDSPDTLTGALFLNVAFSFDKSWMIGPDGKIIRFPPGLGLGGENVQIGPVKLAGMTKAQIAAVVARRAGHMALIAKAIAVANTQFADALDDAGYGAEHAVG